MRRATGLTAVHALLVIAVAAWCTPRPAQAGGTPPLADTSVSKSASDAPAPAHILTVGVLPFQSRMSSERVRSRTLLPLTSP